MDVCLFFPCVNCDYYYITIPSLQLEIIVITSSKSFIFLEIFWRSSFVHYQIHSSNLRKGFIILWSCVTMMCRALSEWRPHDTSAGSKNVHPCVRNHLKMAISALCINCPSNFHVYKNTYFWQEGEALCYRLQQNTERRRKYCQFCHLNVNDSQPPPHASLGVKKSPLQQVLAVLNSDWLVGLHLSPFLYTSYDWMGDNLNLHYVWIKFTQIGGVLDRPITGHHKLFQDRSMMLKFPLVPDIQYPIELNYRVCQCHSQA